MLSGLIFFILRAKTTDFVRFRYKMMRSDSFNSSAVLDF